MVFLSPRVQNHEWKTSKMMKMARYNLTLCVLKSPQEDNPENSEPTKLGKYKKCVTKYFTGEFETV